MLQFAPPDRADDCPARQTLLAFSWGRLTESALESVADHLPLCGACLATMAEIQRQAAEGLDARLRELLVALGRPPGASGEGAPPAGGLVTTVGGRNGHLGGDSVVGSLVGTTFGGYTIRELIGAGGMGVVFRAEQAPVGQAVALKTIRDTYCPRPERLARFRTEGAALARLRHPNVVRLYHFGEHEGRPYFTMELVEGGSLAGRLATGPMQFRTAAELVRVVAQAVAYAHAAHVVHRDLKPLNILLAADGTPKISDFGLAKLLDDAGPRRTETGTALGTPSYMAPEQAAGRAEGTEHPADVYALGAVLYECLTGRPPFEGPNRYAILDQVRTAEPIRPAVRRPGVPVDLEAVCLKCLEKDPGRRYGSAQALADDLVRWLAADPHEPTIARPLGRAGRLARAVRRRPRTVGVGVLLVGLTCGFGWAYSRPKPPALDHESRDNPRAALLIESLLQARNGPVTLIGQTGRPKWYRWQNRRGLGSVADEPDGTFIVSHPGVGWLDLLVDPTTERFRLRTQVRHDRSSSEGEVGVYVGHTVHPGPSGDIHFGIQATLQAVSSGIGPVPTPAGLHPATNGSRVCPRFLVGEGSPRLEERCQGVPGPRLEPLGEHNGRWFNLELTVTPDGVTALLDGWPMILTPESIRRSIDATLATLGKTGFRPADSAVHALRPVFVPRAGVGLLVQRGTAAFRNVSVEPLPLER